MEPDACDRVMTTVESGRCTDEMENASAPNAKFYKSIEFFRRSTKYSHVQLVFSEDIDIIRRGQSTGLSVSD